MLCKHNKHTYSITQPCKCPHHQGWLDEHQGKYQQWNTCERKEGDRCQRWTDNAQACHTGLLLRANMRKLLRDPSPLLYCQHDALCRYVGIDARRRCTKHSVQTMLTLLMSAASWTML